MANALPMVSAKAAKTRPLLAAFNMGSLLCVVRSSQVPPRSHGDLNAAGRCSPNRVTHGLMSFEHEFPRYHSRVRYFMFIALLICFGAALAGHDVPVDRSLKRYNGMVTALGPS